MKEYLKTLAMWTINPLWMPMKAFGLYVKFSTILLWQRFLMWYGRIMCMVFIKVYDRLPPSFKSYTPQNYEGVDSVSSFIKHLADNPKTII